MEGDDHVEAYTAIEQGELHHAQKDRVGNWEISWLAVAWWAAVRGGTAMSHKPPMHGQEKSDPAVVAGNPVNEAAEEAVSESAEPREMRFSLTRPGFKTGSAWHRDWSAYGKQPREKE